jgi:hypothetical protein
MVMHVASILTTQTHPTVLFVHCAIGLRQAVHETVFLSKPSCCSQRTSLNKFSSRHISVIMCLLIIAVKKISLSTVHHSWN